jgi:hypothetical protein
MLRSKIFILVYLVPLFVVLLLAACAPATATPAPIVSEVPTHASVALVKSMEILLLESFPLQVHAVLRGDLPDAGCTTVASVDQVREGNTFRLTLVTMTDPLALCAQKLTPFEKVVPLEVYGLPAGTYTVEAGGVKQTFEFTVDNSLPTEPTVSPTEVEYVMAQQDIQMLAAPDATSQVIGQVFAGQVARVTGTNVDGTWWRVLCPDGSTGSCWVSADPSLTQPAEAPG